MRGQFFGKDSLIRQGKKRGVFCVSRHRIYMKSSRIGAMHDKKPHSVWETGDSSRVTGYCNTRAILSATALPPTDVLHAEMIGTIQTSASSRWCNFSRLQGKHDVYPHTYSPFFKAWTNSIVREINGIMPPAALFQRAAFRNGSKTVRNPTQNSRCDRACQPKISDDIFPSVAPLEKLSSSLTAISYVDHLLSTRPWGLPSSGDHACRVSARSFVASPPCVLSLFLNREGSHYP